jgi:hypothetical protein
MFSNFFPEHRTFYDIMWEKNGTAGQATDDNIKGRMRFLAGKLRQEYRPKLKMFPTYLLSTATTATRMSPSFTSYVSFLFCRL